MLSGIFQIFQREKPMPSFVTTFRERHALMSEAFRGASPQERLSLARQALYLVEERELAMLSRELDREIWRRIPLEGA